MVTEKFFTPADLEEYQEANRKIKRIMAIALSVLTIFISAIWMLVTWKAGYDMLVLGIVSFVLFIVFEVWIYFKLLKSMKEDMNEQIKLVGEVIVLSKESLKNNLFIRFDDNNIREITVTKKLYDKINAGDRLNIEVSKHRKHLFKLTREGVDLKEK